LWGFPGPRAFSQFVPKFRVAQYASGIAFLTSTSKPPIAQIVAFQLKQLRNSLSLRLTPDSSSSAFSAAYSSDKTARQRGMQEAAGKSGSLANAALYPIRKGLQ